MRARFYNPVIGRFTQEDIYTGDGLNLYAYCGNNPVLYYDPSGYAKNCDTKASALGEMSQEDAKRYNSYWENIKASKGELPNYNKAIKKYDVLGDYYEVKLKYEKGVNWSGKIKDMDINDFNHKARKIQELSDGNQLYKTPSNRNAYITQSYKKYIRQSLIEQYKDNPIKLKEELNKLKKMDPDHIWELQLGGLDEFENLEMIDGFTNRRIGQNLGVQMRDVEEGSRIKIVVER